MRPISPYPYFQVGYYIGQLMHPININEDWTRISKLIDNFLALVKEFNLTTSKTYIDILSDFKKEIDESKPFFKLTDEQRSKLSYLVDDVFTALLPEIKLKLIFQIEEKRIDTHKLLFDVSSLMAPGVFNNMPEIARYDFSYAGKCIAYDLPTSAAFHVLRGTEALLRTLYEKITKNTVGNKNWASLITKLRKRSEVDLIPLLDNLDNIRYNYRNPTNHPQMVYNIHDVQDLFWECISTANKINSYL